MSAFTRVTVEGHTLTKWTAGLYEQVKEVYKVLGGTGDLILEQGSYSNAVGASAGTHSGGGALDARPRIENAHNYEVLQRAFRWCQIAGWHRLPIPNVWSEHVHGIVIGDSSAAPVALRQVIAYRSHPPRDGLAGNAIDYTWHPRVIFTSLYPLRSVTLANMQKEARKSRNWLPRPGVFRVQRALNKKHNAGLTVNGLFNRKTKAAYAAWEKSVGGNGDGIPGKYSLVLLGAGRFNVV